MSIFSQATGECSSSVRIADSSEITPTFVRKDGSGGVDACSLEHTNNQTAQHQKSAVAKYYPTNSR